MESRSSIKADKHAGEIAKINCGFCSGETNHKILPGVTLADEDLGFEEGIGEYIEFGFYSTWRIVQCLGCDSLSFEKNSYSSEDYYLDSNNEEIPDIKTEIYPSRIKGRRSMFSKNSLRIVPFHIETVYAETFGSICDKRPILAATGIRALIEAVCKEKSATGRTLEKKIDDLNAKGLLSGSQTEILHKLRILGNEAVHELKPLSQEKLLLALDIVEHLLNEVFILPLKAQKQFN